MNQIRRLDSVPSELRSEYKLSGARPTYWYLNFANNSGWLGGCIVTGTGTTLEEALAEASAKNLNPGGVCRGGEISPEQMQNLPDAFLNAMLGREELMFLRAKTTNCFKL